MPDAASPDDAVVLERTFSAPIEEVWRAWTQADRFAAWYGPHGATIPTAELDVEVGGRRFVVMEMATPDGTMQMRFVGEHRVVEEPQRLVYSEAMVDDGGRPQGRNTEVIVDLAADGGGATALTLTHVGVPADSPGAQGWAMALDDLAVLLTSS